MIFEKANDPDSSAGITVIGKVVMAVKLRFTCRTSFYAFAGSVCPGQSRPAWGYLVPATA